MAGISDQKQSEERNRESAFSKINSYSPLGAYAWCQWSLCTGMSHLQKSSVSYWTLRGLGLSESLWLKQSFWHPPVETWSRLPHNTAIMVLATCVQGSRTVQMSFLLLIQRNKHNRIRETPCEITKRTFRVPTPWLRWARWRRPQIFITELFTPLTKWVT